MNIIVCLEQGVFLSNINYHHYHFHVITEYNLLTSITMCCYQSMYKMRIKIYPKFDNNTEIIFNWILDDSNFCSI